MQLVAGGGAFFATPPETRKNLSHPGRGASALSSCWHPGRGANPKIPNRWCRKLRSTTGYKRPSLQDENERGHWRSALSGLSPGVQVRTAARCVLSAWTCYHF